MTERLKPKPLTKNVDRTTTAYGGPLTADVTAVKSSLVDLPKGARKGLRTAHQGIDDAIAELAVSVPANGAAAGIPTALYQALVTGNTSINQLIPLWQAATLIVEALADTIAIAVDQREQQLSQIADDITSTAKRTKNQSIKTPFQKTLAYKGEAAVKGAKTRKLKKAAAATPAATTTAATTTAATGH